MHDLQQAPFHEVRRLLARVSALESQIEQFRRERQAYSQVPQQVRWVETVIDSVEYPDSSANVFPIRFLDCHFTAAAGTQALDDNPRSTAKKTYARTVSGGYVAEGSILPAFQSRGLGPEGSGEWWLLDRGTSSSTPTTIPFRNDSGEAVPIGAVMLLADTVDVSGTPTISIVKPHAGMFAAEPTFVINTGAAVAYPGTGTCAFAKESYSHAAYDPASTIPPGSSAINYGPQPDSWLLHEARPGFQCLGGATTVGGQPVAKFRASDPIELFGKLVGDLNQGSIAEMKVYILNASLERVDAGLDNIVAKDITLNYREKITKDTWVFVRYYCSNWCVFNAACEKDNTGTPASGNGSSDQNGNPLPPQGFMAGAGEADAAFTSPVLAS